MEKKRRAILFSTYFNYFFQGIGAVILSLNLNVLKELWHANIFQVSFVIGSIGIGRIISLYPAGQISDKLGRRLTVILGAISFIIFFGLVSFAPNIYIAFFLTLFAGFSNALFDTSIYPLITELYPEQKVQSSLSILNKAFISIGQFVLPIIAANFTKYHISIHWLYLLCAVGVLVNLAYFSILPVNKIVSHETISQEVVDNKRNASFKKLGVPLLIYAFVAVAIFTIFTTWVSQFGQEVLNLPPEKSMLYISLYSLCSIISVFCTSYIVNRGVAKLKIMLFDIIMSTLGLLLLVTYPNRVSLLIGTLFIGIFAAGGAWQLGLVTLLEIFPGNKGKYTSYYSLAASIALFIIPTFTGYFAQVNIKSVFVIDIILGIIGLLCLVVVQRNHPRNIQ